MTSSTDTIVGLTIRNTKLSDVDRISTLDIETYPNMAPMPPECIRSQITSFPAGQFIALHNDKAVGYAASIIVSGDIALKAHTWSEVTGNGYATTHNPQGDYLYGMEICVDNAYQNHHIGHLIYDKRKELCIQMRLKGIVAGGRLTCLAQEINVVKTPERYIEMVQMEKIKDRTLLFQLHNNFKIIGILKNYLPEDEQSLGHASHLIWHNPEL